MNTIPELRQIDPASIIIATNIRQTPTLDPAFLDSIRTNGVLTPVSVNETPEGFVLRFGQRRTLAAVAVELATIPALVYPAADDDDAAKQVRIIEQWAENEHRAAVTDADRLNAVEQLSLFGVPAKDIVKRLHTTTETAEAAQVVADSTAARAALTEHADTLTLDQAAAIAEFEDDAEAVASLVEAATEGGFAHTLQQLRHERATAREVAAAVAEIEAAGGRAVTDDSENQWTRLRTLRTPEGEPIAEDEHATCPGHAVLVNSSSYYGGVSKTLVCIDAEGNGHQISSGYAVGESTTRGPMTDQEKAERRELIANNKAYAAAVVVRAEWIEKFARTKGPVKGGEALIAQALVLNTYQRRGWQAELPKYANGITPRTQPARALRVAVALMLQEWHGRHEAKDAWRWDSTDAALYLTAMQSWGYELAPIESTWITASSKPAQGEDVTEDAE